MADYISIKNWSEDERPREKLVQKGANSLSHAELLAILINTGTKQKSAIDIAKEIMVNCNNNLLELGKMTLADIKMIKGIGEKKAITLMAALELGKRRQLEVALIKPKIVSSKDVFNILNPFFLDKTNEEFYVIFLNQAQLVLAVEPISKGGMTATVVDARVIFQRALQLVGTSKIILSHNHPSGNLTASEADKVLTKRLVDAGKIMDIQVLDHIIVAGNQYISFADDGMM